MGAPLVWTAVTVITQLRNTVGDPSGATVTRWTAVELDAYYNRAQLQVVLDTTGVLKTEWKATLTAAQREYKLPAAFLRAKTVLYRASSDDSDLRVLRHVTWDEYTNWMLQNEVAQGEPTAYYFWRKAGDDPITTQPPSIFLDPTPNTAASGITKLYVYGYKHPDTIDSTGASTTVVELEAPYVEAAILFAASLVKRDDGEYGAARELTQAYLERVSQVKEMLVTMDRSAPSRMMAKGARRGQYEWDPRFFAPGG